MAHIIEVDEELAAHKRLDKMLAKALEDELSRARIQSLIKEGHLTLNAQICDNPSVKIKAGDHINLTIPKAKAATPQPENIPLDIVYEDEDLIVINKPAGLTVHPGAGNWSGTLVNALLHHCADSLSGIGGVERPGIVHRLDKETSGLMVVAKHDKAHNHLAAQLKDRSLSRQYLALTFKVPTPPKGEISGIIGRDPKNRLKMATKLARTHDPHQQPPKGWRTARTFYHVQEKWGQALAAVQCHLESGRTHQIRVHMQAFGYPLIGDPLYGVPQNAIISALKKADAPAELIDHITSFPRQALHAQKISFLHPGSGQLISLEASLPPDLEALLAALDKMSP